MRDFQFTSRCRYSCIFTILNLRFNQKQNLHTHVRHIHLGERRYSCSDCGAKFRRKRLLDCHVNSKHKGEKPYSCSLCPATFVYPEHVKKHEQTHRWVESYIKGDNFMISVRKSCTALIVARHSRAKPVWKITRVFISHLVITRCRKVLHKLILIDTIAVPLLSHVLPKSRGVIGAPTWVRPSQGRILNGKQRT